MKKEVVFVMSFPWFSLYQRPHHIAHYFKMAGYSVKVIEFKQPIRLNSLLNRMKFSEHRLDADFIYSVTKYPFSDSLTMSRFKKCMNNILHNDEQETDRLIWLQGVDGAIDYKDITAFKKYKTILDISDSFPDFAGSSEAKQRLEIKEKEAAGKTNVVLAASDRLYFKFKKYNPNTFLVRNGVDIKSYRTITEPADAEFAKKVSQICSSKAVVYEGVISKRIDFDFLRAVIKGCPELIFLFIGMVDITARSEFNVLLKQKNARFIGTINHHLLPWVLSKTEIGIIPFKINELTMAANTIKLYEYLAAGKPVVSTPIPEVERYECSGVVRTAADPVLFVKYLRDMAELSSDPTLTLERLAIAEANNWEARFEEIASICSL